MCVCVCVCVHVHCLKGQFWWLYCCYMCIMVSVQLYNSPSNISEPKSDTGQGTSSLWQDFW